MRSEEPKGAHTPINGPIEIRIGAIQIRAEAHGRSPSQIAEHYHSRYGFERIHLPAGRMHNEFIAVFGEGRESIPVRRYPLRSAEVLPFKPKASRKQARR